MSSDSSLLFQHCPNGSGAPVLPNNTQTAVCGFPSNFENSSVTTGLSGCCEGGVETFGCNSYCSYSQGLARFTACLQNSTDVSNATLPYAFCQSNIAARNIPSVPGQSSGGSRTYTAPRVTGTLLVVMLLAFFAAPTTAAIVHSLDKNPVKRQSSNGCTFDQTANYTTIRNTLQVTAHGYTCASSEGFCPSQAFVDTGLDRNNRTVNGTSAADSTYDILFEVIANATGRSFPAMTSLLINHEVSVMGGSGGTLGFTPYAWCVNGTASGCGNALGSDSTFVDVCGPMFVDENEEIIQGTLLFILVLHFKHATCVTSGDAVVALCTPASFGTFTTNHYAIATALHAHLQPHNTTTAQTQTMAENVPPGPSTAIPTADQPGRPYYESLRTSLRQTLDKKRKLDESLAAIEDQIFKSEGAYLEETAGSGNIVRGFDGWVKGVQVGGRGGGDSRDERRRGRVRDEDRIFSRSSVGWMRAQDGPDSSSASNAATPTASFPAHLSTRGSDAAASAGAATKAAANKKKRPTIDTNDEDEGKPKRSKISYARD
ncbi:hypothetical protein LTR10_009204 [Elasticomyces elasticus]|nr:hypothetical protein LTR10_009204 [Elasticomyces elasticus]KAK4971694.1 hypothetical protein LTR42_007422 [Elasticomyces elasticus]